MAGFLLALTLFITTVFLAIIPIFGVSYTGSEESPIYLITVFLLDGFSIGYVFFKESFSRNRARGTCFPYFIPLAILFIYFFDLGIRGVPTSSIAIKNLQFFFAMAYPGIVIATYCYRYNQLGMIAKNLELLSIICSIGLFISLPSMYMVGSLSSNIEGGANHQTISYVAANCYCIFFISLKSNVRLTRLNFILSKYYRILLGALIIGDAIVCIIGGGRGGAVLLVLNTLILFGYYSREKFFKNVTLFAIAFGIFYLLAINVTFMGINEMFQHGFERAFSFLSPSGVDMTQTSGRDNVYKLARDLIASRPLTGYGLLYQYDVCQRVIDQPYSHNLFYEYMLQGGVFFLIAWCLVLYQMFKKGYKLVMRGGYFVYLIPLVTLPFTMLLFSGTYLASPLYWFSVIYILGECRRKRMRKSHIV